MKPKSPLTKKLVGGQHRLPAELKQEILNSPAKKYKSDAQRKAVHASKAEQSPAKMVTGVADKKNPNKRKISKATKSLYLSTARHKIKKKRPTYTKIGELPSKAEQSPAKLSKKYTYSVTPDPKLDNKPKKGPMGLTRAELAKQANSKKNKESLKKFTKKSPAKLRRPEPRPKPRPNPDFPRPKPFVKPKTSPAKLKKSKIDPSKIRVGPGHADMMRREREREEAKRKEQAKKMRKRALKSKIKKTTKAEKKTQ